MDLSNNWREGRSRSDLFVEKAFIRTLGDSGCDGSFDPASGWETTDVMDFISAIYRKALIM